MVATDLLFLCMQVSALSTAPSQSRDPLVRPWPNNKAISPAAFLSRQIDLSHHDRRRTPRNAIQTGTDQHHERPPCFIPCVWGPCNPNNTAPQLRQRRLYVKEERRVLVWRRGGWRGVQVEKKACSSMQD